MHPSPYGVSRNPWPFVNPCSVWSCLDFCGLSKNHQNIEFFFYWFHCLQDAQEIFVSENYFIYVRMNTCKISGFLRNGCNFSTVHYVHEVCHLTNQTVDPGCYFNRKKNNSIQLLWLKRCLFGIFKGSIYQNRNDGSLYIQVFRSRLERNIFGIFEC